jgi:hypothetical protein
VITARRDLSAASRGEPRTRVARCAVELSAEMDPRRCSSTLSPGPRARTAQVGAARVDSSISTIPELSVTLITG